MTVEMDTAHVYEILYKSENLFLDYESPLPRPRGKRGGEREG